MNVAKRGAEALPAWSVKRLAEAWDCSRSVIYEMIDGGELQTFLIGRRGIRISDQEKQRWEGQNANRTAAEIVPSDDVGPRPLSATRMKMVSAGGRA